MSGANQEVSASVPLLQARGICKSFPGVQALSDIDIAVHGGTLHALVGENGAGKSTLMNILAGVFAPDRGIILLAGEEMRFRNPLAAQAAGVAIIHQELNLVPNLSVAENIFLGREPKTRTGLIDYRKMVADADKLLAMMKATIDPRLPVGRLRVGAQQLVEIAKALSFDAQVIIMDEPTSALSEQESASLFELIESLKNRGVGIIYITHKFKELDQIADQITVLRDGRLIATKPFREVDHDEIVRMMVGRELVDRKQRPGARDGGEALSVQNLSLRSARHSDEYIVRHVSFAVQRGEIVGLFGLMGAGRTELLQSIFGLHPHRSSATVVVAGTQRQIRSLRDAMKAGLAMVPEDRKSDGLVLGMSVAENSTLACLQRLTRCGFVQSARERQAVTEFVNRFSIKSRSLTERVRNLSGGNQQKVVLAKWLATEPTVLLLDEPTRGIDVNAKREIYTLIEELADGGMAIVVASSELPEILAISDRVLVMAEGRLTAECDRADANEEKVLTAALPKTRTRQAQSA